MAGKAKISVGMKGLRKPEFITVEGAMPAQLWEILMKFLSPRKEGNHPVRVNDL